MEEPKVTELLDLVLVKTRKGKLTTMAVKEELLSELFENESDYEIIKKIEVVI